MNTGKKTAGAVAGAIALTALIGFAAASCEEKRDVSQKSSEASVVTNENGSVSRSFTETTVTTNGSMVTERRRETRTTTDAEGNMLATSTSEYAQSYPVGESGLGGLSPADDAAADGGLSPADGQSAPAEDGFMGLKFGAEFKPADGEELVRDEDEPMLLRATFAPKKALAGFDDYYVYVTPKTHKVAKVYACAKEAVEPGANWRRHYLVEALEKRYRTWARPRSWCRPLYSFDIGCGRHVTACLAGATQSYETVLVAWDDVMLKAAADETAELRAEARRSAAEKRSRRVSDAAEAF